MNLYFSTPYGQNVKFDFDFSNYAAKSDIKNNKFSYIVMCN